MLGQQKKKQEVEEEDPPTSGLYFEEDFYPEEGKMVNVTDEDHRRASTPES